MAERIEIDLFCEDRAHEEFLTPIIRRIAREAEVTVGIRPLAARGGHGRALRAFRQAQRVAIKGEVLSDLLVVAIDANCSAPAAQQREIRGATEPVFRDRLVTACPDPHIERWFMADPASFKGAIGRGPEVTTAKCERSYYKRLLVDTSRQAGHLTLAGGLDFAPELVATMVLSGREERRIAEGASGPTSRRPPAVRDLSRACYGPNHNSGGAVRSGRL